MSGSFKITGGGLYWPHLMSASGNGHDFLANVVSVAQEQNGYSNLAFLFVCIYMGM